MTDYYLAPPHIVAGFLVPDDRPQETLDKLAKAISTAGGHSVSESSDNSIVIWADQSGSTVVSLLFFNPFLVLSGVEFALSGDLLGMPPEVVLDQDAQKEKATVEHFVEAAFQDACERLEPLYAAVGFEWRLAEPCHSATCSDAWIPGDLYWSRKLEVHDVHLASDLIKMFGMHGRGYAHGTLITAGGLLEPGIIPCGHPMALGRAAARRLNEAVLAQACRSGAEL